MKNTINLRRLFSPLLLATALLVSCAAASAQDTLKSAPAPAPAWDLHFRSFDLMGTWQVTITPDDGSPSFVGYYTFFSDGNASFSSAGPPIPGLGNPGYGVWKGIKKNQFAATIRMNSYNMAFQFDGTLKINAKIRLTGPDTFTTRDAVTVYDPAGNEIVVLGGTSSGKRIKVEH